MRANEKAPSVAAATAAEGEDQNTHEGDRSMSESTSLPQGSDALSMQVCPRCSGPIEIIMTSSGEAKLAAMSRATPERDIEVCSPCGSDEALRAAYVGYIIPVAEWPVNDPHEHHQPVQDAMNVFCAMNGINL